MTFTRRLFWLDSYQQCFSAQVLEQTDVDGQPGVVLDGTCFYATSGGQPNDTGTLNDTAVIDVQQIDGRIVHVLGGALNATSVSGQIDWERRFDHMQQHSGQHILSAAFEQLLDAATVSFHLGQLYCTIDISIAELSERDAQRVEELANQVVLDNRPVTAKQYTLDEAQELPLRKMPPTHDRIRVVGIDGFDLCACGGTHVRATGEIGAIHIRRWERRKRVTRVEFLCGWRALRDYQQRDRASQRLALSLSVGVDELEEAFDRLGQAEQEMRHQAEHLRKRLLDCELPVIMSRSERVGDILLICRLLEGYDAGNMHYVAHQISQQAGTVALLAVDQPAPRLCFARSKDVDLDMGKLLRESLTPFGGHGGGRPNIAQGGGVDSSALSDVLAQARDLLRSR